MRKLSFLIFLAFFITQIAYANDKGLRMNTNVKPWIETVQNEAEMILSGEVNNSPAISALIRIGELGSFCIVNARQMSTLVLSFKTENINVDNIMAKCNDYSTFEKMIRLEN